MIVATAPKNIACQWIVIGPELGTAAFFRTRSPDVAFGRGWGERDQWSANQRRRHRNWLRR